MDRPGSMNRLGGYLDTAYSGSGDSWMRSDRTRGRVIDNTMDRIRDERSGQRQWQLPQSSNAAPFARVMDRQQLDEMYRHIAQIVSERVRNGMTEQEAQAGLPQISEWSDEVTAETMPWPTGEGASVPATPGDAAAMFDLPEQKPDPGANTTRALTAGQVAQIAYDAGFRGTALTTAVAIAMGESSNVATAHNPNADTGDNSYGLWQINMIGRMGPDRRRRYGLGSNEELFDPAINARAAWGISNGGTNFKPWTVYTSGKYLEYWEVAQQASQAVERGIEPDYPMGGD